MLQAPAVGQARGVKCEILTTVHLQDSLAIKCRESFSIQIVDITKAYASMFLAVLHKPNCALGHSEKEENQTIEN